jgi:hypothetical protein
MDMFACLAEDKDHIDLYDIYVYTDEFGNLIIDYMAKKIILKRKLNFGFFTRSH